MHVPPWQPWKDFIGAIVLAFSVGFLIPFASGLGLGRAILSGAAVAAYFGCVLIRVAIFDDQKEWQQCWSREGNRPEIFWRQLQCVSEDGKHVLLLG